MYQAELRALHTGYLIISAPLKRGALFHVVDDETEALTSEVTHQTWWSLDLSPGLSPSEGHVSSSSLSWMHPGKEVLMVST